MSLPVFFESPCRSRAVPVAACLYLIKAFLAVFALTLLLAPPSHAGYWQVSYTSQGVAGCQSFFDHPTGPVVSNLWYAGSAGEGSGDRRSYGKINNFSHGTVTPTLTWVADNGDMTTDPPDKTVFIRETATAQEAPGQLSPQFELSAMGTVGTVANGWGDPVVTTRDNVGPVLTCTGTHLLQRDGSSGKIVLDAVSLSAANPISTFSNGSVDWWGGGWASVSLNVGGDNRSVLISSNFSSPSSPTYRKGPIDGLHQTGQWENKRASDGSLSDDTLVPDADGTDATYSPNYSGNWGNDSTYSWQASLPNSSHQTLSATGPFNSTSFFGNKTIPTFGGTYHNPPVSDGNADTITLSLKDGVDGAMASNTYTINFHNPITHWLRINTVRHPAPLQGGFNDPHPDWTYLMTIDNGGSSPLTQSMTNTVTLSETQTASFSGQQTLSAPAIAAFQANESITNGKTSTYTYATQTTFAGSPHTRVQFYASMSYEDRFGTCDVYAAKGYQGQANWSGRWTSGAVSVGSIEVPTD